jgi:hypothetical protein
MSVRQLAVKQGDAKNGEAVYLQKCSFAMAREPSAPGPKHQGALNM